jgi:hypothetical protein
MWNPFKKSGNVAAFPGSLSKSIESVAMLYATMGFPFNRWQTEQIQINPEDVSLFKAASHCRQIDCLRVMLLEKLNDDSILTEISIGYLFERATIINQDLTNSFLYFYDLQDDIMNKVIEANQVNKNHTLETYPLESLAAAWLAVDDAACGREGNIDLGRLETLQKCMVAAHEAANGFFSEVTNCINLIDVENFTSVRFRKKRCIYEEVIFRKFNYQDFFEDLEQSNAAAVLAARRRELREAYEFIKLYGDLKVRLGGLLLAIDDRDKHKEDEYYNLFRDWLTDVDKARAKCYALGGQCEEALANLEKLRSSILDALHDFIEKNDSRFILTLMRLFEIYDNSYITFIEPKLLWKIHNIPDPGDVGGFLLSSPIEEIQKFAESAVGKEQAASTRAYIADVYQRLKSESESELREKKAFVAERFILFRTPERSNDAAP